MKKAKNTSPRMGRVGGQAVLEGVMMKSGDQMAVACRKPDGSISLTRRTFVSARKKHKFCNLPLVRGVVNFVEMLKISMDTLNVSAEVMGVSDEPETKFEKWLREKCHIDVMALVSVVGIVLGVALSVFLFMFLPNALAGWILPEGTRPLPSALFEGGMKIVIFVGYLAAVSLMKDMRRVFAYHGAEHKSVACYEAGDELTPAHAKNHTRFHPRCGTSFLFVMILLGILVSVLIKVIFPSLLAHGFGNKLLYTAVKLLVLPLVVGLGFEFILYAGRHENLLVRILSAPGLWMQRLTTKEPDEEMLECAITALKCALPDEFPDFDPDTYDRSPKNEETVSADTENAEVDPAEEAENAESTESAEAAPADSTEIAENAPADSTENTENAPAGTPAGEA